MSVMIRIPLSAILIALWLVLAPRWAWAKAPLQLYVELTPSGGTLTLPPGEYSGSAHIRKPITIDGGGKAVVDGGGSGTVLYIEADNVTVRGLRIINSGRSHDQVDAGIMVTGNGNRITHNSIEDTLFGIHLSNAQDNRIENNRIRSLRTEEVTLRGDAIRLWYSHGNRIENNDIRYSRDMVFSNSRNNQIIGNCMSDSRISMELVYSPGNEIRDNRLSGNFSGITVIYSDNLRIQNNRVEHMRKLTGSCISVKESASVLIEGNEIAHCAVGLLATSPLEQEDILYISNNLFTFNDVAAFFFGEKGGHVIKGNLFVDNFVDAMGSSTATSRLNNWEGNYWDSYAGFDLDHDGIGDRPYRVFLYSDRIWMERSMARFYRGTPVLSLIDFMERLVPSSEPDLLYMDAKPLMQPPQRRGKH